MRFRGRVQFHYQAPYESNLRFASSALGQTACRLFFFQAEDGIRDLTVTGVQTCALPIWWHCKRAWAVRRSASSTPPKCRASNPRSPATPSALQAPCTRPARPPPTAACCASNWPPGSPHAAPNCATRSEEHTSELQSQSNLVCRLLLEKKKKSSQTRQSATDATRTRAGPRRSN